MGQTEKFTFETHTISFRVPHFALELLDQWVEEHEVNRTFALQTALLRWMQAEGLINSEQLALWRML